MLRKVLAAFAAVAGLALAGVLAQSFLAGMYYVNPGAMNAWGLFVIVIALILGFLKNRRASIEVGVLILALVAAHVLRVSSQVGSDEYIIGLFAFIPSRYAPGSLYDWGYGGLAADLWSPFTYTFLHGDGSHLFFNAIALAVFGRAVAWRLGTVRFILFFAASGAAGALVHLLFKWGDPIPLVGASASIFGIMAATFRFVPRTRRPLRTLLWPDETLRTVPLASFTELFTERRNLVYLVTCLIIYPLGLTALILGTLGDIAFAAHVGGFALGLFAFGKFDRTPPAISNSPAQGETVSSP